MPRTFAYCRVSTTEQTTENQVVAISNAGYEIQPHRIIEETISGSTPALNRVKFQNLINNQLEPGDTLVVLKLDRLGRDNMDVQNTVSTLSEKGINLICLDLPISNLSNSEGKLMLQVMGAFAEFERNRIAERTREGLERAKAKGKVLGRPPAINTRKRVQEAKERGLGQSATARDLGIGLSTVKRHWV